MQSREKKPIGMQMKAIDTGSLFYIVLLLSAHFQWVDGWEIDSETSPISPVLFMNNLSLVRTGYGRYSFCFSGDFSSGAHILIVIVPIDRIWVFERVAISKPREREKDDVVNTHTHRQNADSQNR